VNPSLRVAALLALVVLGIATCAGQSSGDKSSWRFVSVTSGQQGQTGKQHR
jgi:hypothetical protein